jgi:hypothetical protein
MGKTANADAEVSIQSLGGLARREAMTPEERKESASLAAKERWKQERAKRPLRATHRGNFDKDFGIDVDCYVLDDEQKTGVISKRGMGIALGMGEGGSVFPYFIRRPRMAVYVGSELAEKIANPLIFQWAALGAKMPPTPIHGYDVTILIDVCKAIIAAEEAGVMGKRHQHIVRQARVILTASAKAGIKNLVYALAGYDVTKAEVVAAFKFFVREEAREYEKEFPDQLYAEWYRLYQLPKPEKNKPWKFKALTVDHVYKPLARSNGKILELTREQRANGEKRWKKLHQFLSEIGVKALRTHLGQLLGIAQVSNERGEYERHVERIFSAQLTLDL